MGKNKYNWFEQITAFIKWEHELTLEMKDTNPTKRANSSGGILLSRL